MQQAAAAAPATFHLTHCLPSLSLSISLSLSLPLLLTLFVFHSVRQCDVRAPTGGGTTGGVPQRASLLQVWHLPAQPAALLHPRDDGRAHGHVRAADGCGAGGEQPQHVHGLCGASGHDGSLRDAFPVHEDGTGWTAVCGQDGQASVAGRDDDAER